MFAKFFAGTLVVLGCLIVLGVLIAMPIVWLWNSVCPDLFDLPRIGFWQAWGLYALICCLFPRRGN